MRPRTVVTVALAVAALSGRAVEAQSVLSLSGLGVPVDALDARTRALGSLGVGLFSSTILPVDPNSVGDLILPTVTASGQPTWGEFTRAGETGSVRTNRFPLIGVAYPFAGTGGVASLTLGGFLDQRWAVQRSDTLFLGNDPIALQDRFTSDGSISLVRIGWSQGIGDRLRIGVSGGSYLGEVTEELTRSLDSLDVGGPVISFRERAVWQYSGPALTGGVTFDPVDALRIGAVVNWSGTLESEREVGVDEPASARDRREFDLPVEFRVGVSARLTPVLLLHGGLQYASWSEQGTGLDADELVGDVMSYGGGLEWFIPWGASRSFPLRVGYRREELPFRFEGDAPVSTTLSGGLGLNLVQVEDRPLARVDLGLERGDRKAGSLDESFWRLTISLTVSSG